MNEEQINNMTEQELDSLMPTPEEVETLRQALNRRKVSAPDVDREWQRFVGSRRTEPAGKTRGLRRGAVIGFVAGVAATLLIVFLLADRLFPHDKGQLVFEAINETPEVTLTTGGGLKVEGGGRILSALDSAAKISPFRSASPLGSSKNPPPSTLHQLCTLTTPRGKDYQLTLPDGSKVWMNASSRLEFPERFTGGRREVRLSGEAYFEVTKDAAHPFIVKTDYFSTRVLGTSFNVRAYSERSAAVVLVDGSVEVSAGKTTQLIKPDQKLSIVNSQFSIDEVDTYPYVQWKDGFFYFDKTPLLEIMQELGRWYNVNIVFEDERLMRVRLHFVAERNLSLAAIVRHLNELDVVQVELSGREITVK